MWWIHPNIFRLILPVYSRRIEMKRQLIITLLLIALLQLIGYAVAENVSSLEICGSVATGSTEWDASTFAGFYYDIDDNIKTETLTATVTDRKLREPDGVVTAPWLWRITSTSMHWATS